MECLLQSLQYMLNTNSRLVVQWALSVSISGRRHSDVTVFFDKLNQFFAVVIWEKPESQNMFVLQYTINSKSINYCNHLLSQRQLLCQLAMEPAYRVTFLPGH